MLFTAGRNPITRGRHARARNRPIHWAQESFDQAGLAREFVKWDYELRNFVQLETVIDRALAITTAEPQGPGISRCRARCCPRRRSRSSTRTHRARRSRRPRWRGRRGSRRPRRCWRPRAGRSSSSRRRDAIPGAVASLVALAEALGAPVVDQFQYPHNFPQHHELHGGFDATPYLDEADAIAIVESDVPWFRR